MAGLSAKNRAIIGRPPALFFMVSPAKSRTTVREMKNNASIKNTAEKAVFFMVAIAGFEPANEGVKVPCLTAWRYRSIIKPCEGIFDRRKSASTREKACRGTLLGWVVGFEPTVSRTTIWRFNRLNYTHHIWHAMKDSNLRPTA